VQNLIETVNQVVTASIILKNYLIPKEKVISELHKRWSDPNSEIVKRMNSFAEKSPDILKPILES